MSSPTTATKEVRTIAITLGQLAAIVIGALVVGAWFMMSYGNEPATAATTPVAVTAPAAAVVPPKA